MKRRWIAKALALTAVLALSLPAVALSEEMGEIDLYDPSVYADVAQDGTVEETQPAGQPEAGPALEAFAAELALDEPAQGTPEEAPAQPEPMTEAVPEEAPQEYAQGEPETGMPPEEAPQEFLLDPMEAVSQAEMAVAAPAPAELAPEGEAAVEPAPEIVVEPNLRMGLGEQVPLDGNALLGGAGAAVFYASDHPEIASVDAQTGILSAVAEGVARLTVTADTGATATYVVAVMAAPSSLSFGVSDLTLGCGEFGQLTALVPEGAASAQITYLSSKAKVVEVDAAGNLTAKKTGKAVITATAYNGATTSCTVQVLKAPSKLTISEKAVIMSVGETRALAVKLPKKSASQIYWESDNPAVVTVDAAGNLTGIAGGTANITARSCNNKQASCRVAVLDGAAPTVLVLNVQSLQLCVKETFQLIPSVGEGEAAVYAWSTSKKKVATVSENGVVTARRAGTAVITVTTQNGLQAAVTVTVGKAPSKVALSATGLSLEVGQTAQLAAKLSKGAISSLVWESSAPSVASVDGSGLVTAQGAGTALIRVTTLNGKSALCKLTVTAPGLVAEEHIDMPAPGTEAELLTAAQMLKNLSRSGSLGSKKDAILSVMELLIKAGFEPAFAAGVGANVYSEGTYGRFESSKYVSNYKKRPMYFCYLDGGDYYTQQEDGEYVLTAVYMSQEELDAYTGEVEGRLRFGEANYYRDNFSGKYAQDIDLSQLEALMEALAKGSWQGKFGLGVVQWTGGRTQKLVALYRKYAGTGNTLTKAQVIAAENEMILSDFVDTYSGVYAAWRAENSGALETAEAARSAAALVCTRYEIPVDKESKAVTRGNKAVEMYRKMVGE